MKIVDPFYLVINLILKLINLFYQRLVKKKTVEEEDFLRQSIVTIFPFDALDSEQINEIIPHFQLYTVQSDQILMKEKEEGDYFYLIEKGVYEVLIENKQAKICNINV